MNNAEHYTIKANMANSHNVNKILLIQDISIYISVKCNFSAFAMATNADLPQMDQGFGAV